MKTIKLMPEFFCYPLWDLDRGSLGYGAPIDPTDLPITEDLKGSLVRWAAAFDATLDQRYPPDSRFATPEDEAWFRAEGHQLTERLKAELGSTYQIESKF